MPAGVGLKELESVSLEISKDYPKLRPRRRFQGKFELKEGQPLSSETVDLGVDGYLNWSSDEKQVTQFRLDGFSFNRLRPYTGWETCYPEVMRRWAFFK